METVLLLLLACIGTFLGIEFYDEFEVQQQYETNENCIESLSSNLELFGAFPHYA